MSSTRIEQLLKESHQDLIPVPRLAIEDIKEDPLSKQLRKFDNAQIVQPLPNQSGVYINTNESGVATISKKLTLKPLIIKAFHFGFSGWHNFDIMALRCSERGLICDFNPENALFLHLVLLNVRACENRGEFIKIITEFIKKFSYEGARTNANKPSWLGKVTPFSVKFSFNVSDEPIYADHSKVFEEVEIELQRESSWLFTDERYAHIRTMALQDKIALITENICAFDKFNSIARLLMDNMIQIDTVYVSNVSEWVFTEEDRDSFFKTIQFF